MAKRVLSSRSGPGVQLAMNPGDDAVIAAGVSLVSTSGTGITDTGFGTVSVDGTVAGLNGIIIQGDASQASQITIGTGGRVVASDGGTAVSIVNGLGTITNRGTIQASGSFATGVQLGAGTFDNAGTIQASGFSAMFGNGQVTATNTGTMIGDVYLGAGYGTVFNAAAGRVYGTIRVGYAQGTTVVAGQNGGTVIGGTGNDRLYANQSRSAADHAATFTLDGGAGNNALYGGGAFNTFLAGGSTGTRYGVRNAIHGGLSLMGDVAGYANNTIDFSATPSGRSVYVDLLNGHNAYINSSADRTGSYTFEDAIRNVPNVIGSSGRDLIRADDTGDRIEGGAGADILFGGCGRDTFVYSGFDDSSAAAGYDRIVGFTSGQDKLDLSALGTDRSHLRIASGANATSLYVEQTAGTHGPHDLMISFAGAKAIAAGDVLF